MAKCYPILKACQRAESRLDYAFNWTHEFARKWQANYPYDAATAVRPSALEGATGFEYTSSGGVSGAQEPVWPDTLGATVQDGSITWTAAVISNASLRHRLVAPSEWTADTGLTLDDVEDTDSPGLQESRIWVSGGAAGTTYRNFVEVTTDQDAVYEGELRVKVE